MSRLPKRFERFLTEFPEIAVAYESLGDSIHRIGPLSERERAIVKIGIAVGSQMEGSVHAQIRKGIKAKLTKKEMRQIALLAIPSIGFPAAMAALSWMDDILDMKKGK